MKYENSQALFDCLTFITECDNDKISDLVQQIDLIKDARNLRYSKDINPLKILIHGFS